MTIFKLESLTSIGSFGTLVSCLSINSGRSIWCSTFETSFGWNRWWLSFHNNLFGIWTGWRLVRNGRFTRRLTWYFSIGCKDFDTTTREFWCVFLWFVETDDTSGDTCGDRLWLLKFTNFSFNTFFLAFFKIKFQFQFVQFILWNAQKKGFKWLLEKTVLHTEKGRRL